MAQSTLFTSSIGRKLAMALSGVFLISFLVLHVSLNMTSVIDKDTFNRVSHFMGYNPVVQYLLQPILAFGVVFHFIAGITTRYYGELVHKFRNPVRTGLYCMAFVLLGFHLWHGFTSSMQSVGFRNQYSRTLSKLGRVFAIAVPACFVFIALYHHFGH